MTALALREATDSGRRVRSTGRLFDPGGKATLDDMVTAVWEAAVDGSEARCLICGGPVSVCEPRIAAAECANCGSRLE